MSKIEKITLRLYKEGTINVGEMHAIITSCKLHASISRATRLYGFEAYKTAKKLTK